MKRTKLSLSLVLLAVSCSPASPNQIPTSTPTVTPPATPVPLASKCTSNEDCANTSPSCAPNAKCDYAGNCVRIAQDTMCAASDECVLKDTLADSGCKARPECKTNSDCDDGTGCTLDECVENKCKHTVDDSVCGSDAICLTYKVDLLTVDGAPTGCYQKPNAQSSNEVCGGKNECTSGTYGVNFTCEYMPVNDVCVKKYGAGYTCDQNAGCVAPTPPPASVPPPVVCQQLKKLSCETTDTSKCNADGSYDRTTSCSSGICVATGCQPSLKACPAGVDCVVAPVVTTPVTAPTTTPPPVADDHQIACVAKTNGKIGVELQGNLKTGTATANLAGTPSFVGYGAETTATYSWSAPNSSYSVGNIVVQGDIWTVPAFELDTTIQGIRLYIVVDGKAYWLDIVNIWKVTGCTRVDTELYTNKK